MAYQAKREKKCIEDLELVNENGEVERTIHVELDAGAVVQKLSSKYIALLRAQQEAAGISEGIDTAEDVQGAYMKLGQAVTDIMAAVFGEEDAGYIVDFYSGNYVEMVKQVVPFISDVVIPKVRKIAQENKQDILNRYNRKTRRGMKRRMR